MKPYKRSLRKDLAGKKFGMLSVISLNGRDKGGRALWLCECDCGNSVVVEGYNLKSGHSTSCGCYRKNVTIQRSTTHGLSHDSLYRIFATMITRCCNPNNKAYKYYGGRGINIDSEWIGVGGFQSFYDWSISNGYKKGLTIDRIDNNGNYCPDNCRWVSMQVQSNNKSNNVRYEVDGESLTIAQIAKKMGVSYNSIYCKIRNNGMPI